MERPRSLKPWGGTATHSGPTWRTAIGMLAAVRNGKLTATIVMPLTVPLALDMLVTAIRTGTLPAELTLIDSTSFPTIDALASVGVDAD